MSIKSFLKKITRYDRCVYWPPNGKDNYNKVIPGIPREVNCRWELNTVEFTDREGVIRISNSQVYIDPDETVEFGGILWHGKYADLISETDPYANSGSLEIRQIGGTPDPKNKCSLIMAYL